MAKEKKVEEKVSAKDVNEAIVESVAQTAELKSATPTQSNQAQRPQRQQNREADERGFNAKRNGLIKFIASHNFNPRNNNFINKLNAVYLNRDFLNSVLVLKYDINDSSRKMVDILRMQSILRERANNMFFDRSKNSNAINLNIKLNELISKHNQALEGILGEYKKLVEANQQ